MILKEKEISNEIIERLKEEIFIYPTDTIYGIGCNALNKELVKKIREIKNRDNKPFSVIAPSKEWILNNFDVEEELIGKYLPGPYTLLLKKKDQNFLSEVSNNEMVGVRIPDCKFTKILQKLEIPIVTTSVNLSGEKPANKIGEIDEKILNKVKLIIDSGELNGKPSTLIKDGGTLERK
ncbi:threonylcarbamoyl-AMP synthase [Candidatus Pacearchaeota archaeon ex4484_71]|nr:MAG: threonylcarbamoyl-AMP synthase [Candidatus Pacearchaeota archaeon ex4484_71]